MPTHGRKQVYIIEHELGPVKIGIANSPERRLRDLQVSTPFELKLRKTEKPDNAERVEKHLHERFDKYHIRGEWFDIPPDQRDIAIPTRFDRSGEPDVSNPYVTEREMNQEWAEMLERLFTAMQITKYPTSEIDKIRNEWQDLHDDDETKETEDTGRSSLDDLHDVEQDTPSGKVRCSQCGHYFDMNEPGCPTCGSGDFSDGTSRY